MDWDWETSDEDVHTAYHEAGHAIVGCALGARIQCVSLSQASEFDDLPDLLPRRFGDCIVNWGRIDSESRWQQQRELLTILAGPIAELVYRQEDADSIELASWAMDWQQALRCVGRMHADRARQIQSLQNTSRRLRRIISGEPVWPAIAALADELLLGDEIEGQRVEEIVRFWM